MVQKWQGNEGRCEWQGRMWGHARTCTGGGKDEWGEKGKSRALSHTVGQEVFDGNTLPSYQHTIHHSVPHHVTRITVDGVIVSVLCAFISAVLEDVAWAVICFRKDSVAARGQAGCHLLRGHGVIPLPLISALASDIFIPLCWVFFGWNTTGSRIKTHISQQPGPEFERSHWSANDSASRHTVPKAERSYGFMCSSHLLTCLSVSLVRLQLRVISAYENTQTASIILIPQNVVFVGKHKWIFYRALLTTGITMHDVFYVAKICNLHPQSLL